MWIEFTKEMCQALGTEVMKAYGWDEEKSKWKTKGHEISLSNLTKAQSQKLRKQLEGIVHLPRVQARIREVDSWIEILEGEKVRCKKIKQFEPMLKQYLKKAPNYWVWAKREYTDVWQPYYVSNIFYQPPVLDRYGNRTEPYVQLTIWWMELGTCKKGHLTFYRDDCEDLTPGQALAGIGYYTESPDRLASYKANCEKYQSIWDKIGLQFLAIGTGEDVEHDEDNEDRWWRRAESTIRLDREGEPSRVVIDVLSESGKEGKSRDDYPTLRYWGEEPADHEGDEDDDDDDIGPGDEDEDQDDHYKDRPEVPLKPAVKVFDLRRHARLKVHVDQLTLYQYDTKLSAKLVLPSDIRSLVDMLVSARSGFKDIVGGKGTGAIIMCAGPPGTGKTLTSEVYSEAMERPLYSVQCSQLGTDETSLEKNLLKVFARAVRWNAILLLDEADVYVTKRGSDLQQNAIVGVFLRVLEYYGGVMFLTTNRADLVDDAIASRCLARIDYQIPSETDQAKIWRTLADTAGIEIDDSSIRAIVRKFPKLSGRDVKNLLKLGSMVAAGQKREIGVDTIEFVKRFKPTDDAVTEF